LLVGVKLLSLAIVADGIFSLLEGICGGMYLITTCTPAAPLEPLQVQRRRKFEIWTAVLLTGPLFICSWEILGSCVERFLHRGHRPLFSWWGIFFLLGSLGIQYALAGYKKERANTLNSRLLAGYALRDQAGFASLGTVLAGVIVTALGWPYCDAFAAAVIVALTCLSSYRLLDRSIEYSVTRQPTDTPWEV